MAPTPTPADDPPSRRHPLKTSKGAWAPHETPEMPTQLEQYRRYHNRLASFLDWPLKWEIAGAKPSPEALARGGFFSHHAPPHERDNVVCPYCKLFLDRWEPGDNPLAEHRLRAPHCEFLRGPGVARRRRLPSHRRLGAGAGGSAATHLATADAAAGGEKGEMREVMPAANKILPGGADGTSAGDGMGEMDQIDAAVSNAVGGPTN